MYGNNDESIKFKKVTSDHWFQHYLNIINHYNVNLILINLNHSGIWHHCVFDYVTFWDLVGILSSNKETECNFNTEHSLKRLRL